MAKFPSNNTMLLITSIKCSKKSNISKNTPPKSHLIINSNLSPFGPSQVFVMYNLYTSWSLTFANHITPLGASFFFPLLGYSSTAIGTNTQRTYSLLQNNCKHSLLEFQFDSDLLFYDSMIQRFDHTRVILIVKYFL